MVRTVGKTMLRMRRRKAAAPDLWLLRAHVGPPGEAQAAPRIRTGHIHFPEVLRWRTGRIGGCVLPGGTRPVVFAPRKCAVRTRAR